MQSGNIVLETERDSDELAAALAKLLAREFGLDVPVVVRTASELAEVVDRNPFPAQAASNPKALQVTFHSDELTQDLAAALEARATPTEKVAVIGREVYSWHPNGIARSKLALAITPKYAAATARNWTTVTKLLEMATTDAD